LAERTTPYGEDHNMADFRLGSVLGFEIRIDISWFIIFFLIFWSLAASVFPAWYPELDSRTHMVMGGAGSLLFFASLLIHELSHSVVARSKGIPVAGITLFIFGGMARTSAEAETPRDELLIAGVGPLASLVLGIGFWSIGVAGTELGWSLGVVGVARYLAFINVVLALFNLLPGFPLDGGRVFRALVWGATGDQTKATRWATQGGQWLGLVLIFLGIVQTLGGAVLGGLWLILIGWFLRAVAGASLQQHIVRHVLGRIRAHQLMTPDPETVQASVSLHELVDVYLFGRRYQSFPVVSGSVLTGLVTLQEVKPVPRERWAATTVAEVMVPVDQLPLAAPDESMSSVFQRMSEAGATRTLVVRGASLLGIISASDVAGWVQRVQALEELTGQGQGA